MTPTILTILQTLVFTVYIVYIMKTRGKLTSISASSYSFKGQDKWYFLLFLWSLAILNLFQDMGVWGFLTSAGLIFTGITVNHSGSFKPENYLHTFSAVAMIILAALGMYFVHGMLFPLVVIAIGIGVLYNNKTFIWDIEALSMYVIMFAYLLR